MEAHLPRHEILSRLETTYCQFTDALAQVKAEQMVVAGVVGVWSVKDLAAHLIFWNDFPVQELQAALQGKTVSHPEGTGDEINAQAVAVYRDQNPEVVRRALDESYTRLINCVKSLPDTAFEAGSAFETILGESVHGTLANNTYEHWPIHEAQIRAWTGTFDLS